MITLVTRFIFMVAGAVGGLAVSQYVEQQGQIPGLETLPSYYVIIVFIILGWSFGYLLGGIVGRELTGWWRRFEDQVSELAPSDIVVGTAGLILGLLAAVLFAWPLRLIRPAWLGIASSLSLSLFGAYLGVRIALVKRKDFARLIPGTVERVDPGLPAPRELLLDTSAVIDGRFLELRRIGFMDGVLRVPRFVLSELQTLADSADDNKRARGRRGLDLLSTVTNDEIEVFERDYPELKGVDDKLMRLSSESDAPLVTVDYNLTKVARVRGIGVLNVNELAAAVRPNFLPGERIRLRLVKTGKEPDQGVGYLEDGTMVVVQDGRDLVGGEVDTEVTSVLQTSAGRMIFARLAQSGGAA